MRPTLPLVFLACAGEAASAQDSRLSKWNYNLFNPTPREQRREMSADRPDFTESPYTVDAGAVQVEMSLFDYSRDGDAEAWSVFPANLKVGLLNSTDLQVVLSPYVKEDDGADTADGLGDTEVRLKVNLWGNDSGETAFAFMPFVKIPTGSGDLTNDRIEGGLIFPFAMSLSERVGLGLMFEADFVFDDVSGDYNSEFITTGVLGFDVTDRVGTYVELIGIASTASDVDYRAIIGAGATYSISGDVSLDAGLNIGLTGDTGDLNFFSGITFRF